MNPRTLIATLGVPLLACATTTPGSQPHEMSAEQHEAAARQEEQTTAGHAAKYGPNASWTSVTNPTDVELREAEEHRRRAADHRAASAALRDAETRACIGISSDNRDMSPFERTEDIESVIALNERRSSGKQSYGQMVGATVTFRAVPGMTAEWLQRMIDCHLARNAALGHVVPEMPNCPLVPNGVAATVSSTGRGFAVAIQSNDPATAMEILARAERLVAPGGTNVPSQR